MTGSGLGAACPPCKFSARLNTVTCLVLSAGIYVVGKSIRGNILVEMYIFDGPSSRLFSKYYTVLYPPEKLLFGV